MWGFPLEEELPVLFVSIFIYYLREKILKNHHFNCNCCLLAVRTLSSLSINYKRAGLINRAKGCLQTLIVFPSSIASRQSIGRCCDRCILATQGVERGLQAMREVKPLRMFCSLNLGQLIEKKMQVRTCLLASCPRFHTHCVAPGSQSLCTVIAPT